MKDYIRDCLRTESPINADLLLRLDEKARIVHAAFGLTTEVGEFVDGLKRHVFYGTPYDVDNAKEEISDLLWYLAILMDEFGLSFEECMEAVIRKLRARYPAKFDGHAAVNRDLAAERTALENHGQEYHDGEYEDAE